mmetsp:Transcript_15381/g.24087  ORF Transcript_15381/g.24087 Transcript_15381/m.24087 type:complete len:99 (-) Transcript_15381:200-496(-)
MIVNQEKDLEYDESQEWSAVGHAVLATKQSILMEKAKGANPGKGDEIDELQNTQSALREQIRRQKNQKTQRDSDTSTGSKSEFATYKVEFPPSSDQGW